MGLIAELKRRNVIRMAGLYLVAAWLLVQVSATLLPAFEAPTWVFRSIVLVLGVAFVPALIFSWVYELTPGGIKRDAEVPPEQSIGHLTGRRMDRVIIAVLALALGYFALDKFVLAPRRATVATPADAPARAVESPAANDRSIAVLPFQNMSEDKGNQYFADGIAEELLNQLAKAPDLQVAGRTSSFAFRDKDQDLRGIAQQLGVAWLLEGSVRRSGNRVRITAQLIKAATGFHAWSETYDRDLTEIFALQDEIAGAIAAALKLSLGTQKSVPAQIPVPAYDAFLQGQALMASRRLDDLDAARTQFQEAIRIAPDYAPAYVSLARVDLLIPLWTAFSGRTRRFDDLMTEAERLIERALALDPNSASAYAALGTLRSSYQWRWDEAGKAFERALELAPGSAEIANFAGDYYRIVLDRERAFANERRALELDPMARYNLDDMAWVYVAFRDVPEAIHRAEAVRAVAPELFDPYNMLVWALGEAKRFPEMHQAIADARQRTKSPEQNFLLLEFWAALAENRRGDALSLIARLEPFADQNAFSPAYLGFGYLVVGESAKARRWLERALDQHDYNLVYNEPLDLEQLAKDPATRDLLERPGIRELREIRRRNGAIKE